MDLATPVALGAAPARELRTLHERLRNGGSSALERDERLTAVLAALAASHGRPPRPDVPGGAAQARAVGRARDLLHERALGEIRLEHLAREAGFSPFHLARSFTAHTSGGWWA